VQRELSRLAAAPQKISSAINVAVAPSMAKPPFSDNHFRIVKKSVPLGAVEPQHSQEKSHVTNAGGVNAFFAQPLRLVSRSKIR